MKTLPGLRGAAIAGLAASICLCAPARAADPETIVRRVDEAAALYRAQGVGALCSAAFDADGPFQSDDAYVFVFLRDGRLICHPRPDLNAMRAGQMAHVGEMLANAEARPSGAWTRYPWPHPETLELGVKSTLCRIVGRPVICAGSFFPAGTS